MIKVIDNQGCNFMEDCEFKNKNELRFRFMSLAENEEVLNEKDLREFTLNDFLEIWDCDIEKIK